LRQGPFIPAILAHRDRRPPFKNLVSTGNSSGVKIFLQTADIPFSQKDSKISCSNPGQILELSFQKLTREETVC